MTPGMLYPPGLRCALCGRRVQGAALCPRCDYRLVRLPVAACALCEQGDKGGLCGVCAQRLPALDGLAGALAYQDRARQAILRYKFMQQPQLRRLLAAELYRAVRAKDWADDVQCVAAVPLHPLRLLQRGYNQSALLARPVAAALGVRYAAGALRRVHYQSPSAYGQLSARQRRQRAQVAFVAGRPGAVAGKTVLLIDDVLTTGSTLCACAAVLRAMGAVRVYAAVAAVDRLYKDAVDKAAPLQ